MYHKNYDPHAADQNSQLRQYCRVIKNQEEYDNLGPDWVDHSELGKK